MKTISEKGKKWIDKAFEKNACYYALVSVKGKMFYIGIEKEMILTCYASADFGEGMQEFISYDTYETDVQISGINIVLNIKDNKKMIIMREDQKHQVFGFSPAELAEDREVELERPIQYLVMYFRTPKYHTMIFWDREYNDLKIIEELAGVDQKGDAVPDAITTCMLSLYKALPKKEEKKEEPRNE